MTFAPVQSIRGGHVQHGTDAGLYVEFYMEAVKDEEASVKEGRPIFKDVEFIKIIPVGDKNTVICRPVKLVDDGQVPPDHVRWPNQYTAFKNQQTQVTEGTPVEQWPILTKAQALSFKAVNVHTVEQLALVTDANLFNLGMGARDLREKAKAFIAQAKDGSGLVQLQEDNASLRAELEGLKNQLKGFMAETGDKPKRGRPAKTEE